MTTELLDFPTQEELQQLYENSKDKEEGLIRLSWFAWRNSLRAVQVLGCMPLEEIWKQNTCANVFNIIRGLFVLASVSIKGKTDFSFYDMKYIESESPVSISVLETINAALSILNNFDCSRIVSNANLSSLSSYTAFTNACANVNCKNIFLVTEANIAATRSDVNFLVSSKGSIIDEWFSKPLWSKEFFDSSTHSVDELDCWKNSLFDGLRKNGLDFLANDLQNLYDGYIDSISHIENYGKQISDVELKDFRSLRAVILNKVSEITAVRILLLGPGGAGKSTLADRLLNKPVVEKKVATKGIKYQLIQLDSNVGAFKNLDIPNNLKMYLWDFGGQALYYGLHKTFLHENCVYVLVVDSRHEQSPDEWLQQIRHLSENVRTRVLLVSNIYESCHNQLNEQRLQREFESFLNLSFHYFSCNEPEDKELNSFKQKLLDVAKQSRFFISKSLFEVGSILEKSFSEKPIVSYIELKNKLIKEYSKKRNSYDSVYVLDKLKALGLIIFIDPAEKSRCCLSPNWVIEKAYQLLSFECLRKYKGVVTLYTIQEEADEFLTDTEIIDLLSFLLASRLCVRLHDDDDSIFFPDMAISNEPFDLFEKYQYEVKLELQFPYLPIGFFSRLVSYWMYSIPMGIYEHKDIWREGFILRYTEKRDTGIWIDFNKRKAVIQLNCFGDSLNMAEMLIIFWEGLTNLNSPLIYPIKGSDILPLLSLNPLYFVNIQGKNKQLRGMIGVSQNFDQLPTLDYAIKKIEETSKVASKTEIHIHGDNTGNIFTGKENRQNFTYDDHSKIITVDNSCKELRKELLNILEKVPNIDSETVEVVKETINDLSEIENETSPAKKIKLGKRIINIGKIIGSLDKISDFSQEYTGKAFDLLKIFMEAL